MTAGALMTADELLHLPDDGWRRELVRGELRTMSPAGARHGRVAPRIIASLIAHVDRHELGAVYTTDTGFRISQNPDTVRAPDAAFVRTGRVVDTPKFFEGAPDVAFEVVSPNDTYSQIEEKTLDWLRSGVQAVVIVDPRTRSARIHRSGSTATVPDVLEIDDVIPGWRLHLEKIFA